MRAAGVRYCSFQSLDDLNEYAFDRRGLSCSRPSWGLRRFPCAGLIRYLTVIKMVWQILPRLRRQKAESLGPLQNALLPQYPCLARYCSSESVLNQPSQCLRIRLCLDSDYSYTCSVRGQIWVFWLRDCFSGRRLWQRLYTSPRRLVDRGGPDCLLRYAEVWIKQSVAWCLI